MNETRGVAGRRMIRILVPLLVLATALPAPADPADVELTVAKSSGPDELTLAWSGGTPAYHVFRSPEEATVVEDANRVADLLELSLVVERGVTAIEFFQVTDSLLVDPANSRVFATSACLTAGTGALATVVVDLFDALNQPIPNGVVSIETTNGSLGLIDDDGGTYWATLTPPGAAGVDATVLVEANGVPLDTVSVVDIAGPFTDSAGGAGGCPADGNLRVRVVDETGAPVASARVLIGDEETFDAFRTVWNAPPDAVNTAVTDVDGIAEFVDLGSALDGPLTVTAAAADRRYFTWIDVDAADLVIPLSRVYPDDPTGELTGTVTPVSAPNGAPIEFATVVPDMRLDELRQFSLDSLFSDLECYSPGGVTGDVPIQRNVYLPAQCALFVFGCLQSLPEHPWTSAFDFGERKILALRGSAPLLALISDDVRAMLRDASLDGIGVEDVTVNMPGPLPQTAFVTESVTGNVSCNIANVPPLADTLCVAGGDWDSAGDPGLAPGEGRLFISGYGLLELGAVGTVSGVSTVDRVGDFAGIEYIAGAVAQYLDPTEPGIPAGTALGQTAILDRSGADLSGGATLSFTDFFPIRTLSRAERDFSLAALPGAGHPAAHVNRVSIDQVVTETYTACGPEQRIESFTLWEIYAPGASDGWTLPTPPAGWPRQSIGGDLAGLVDPTATPEDDTLTWTAETSHLGTHPGFDFDRLRLVGLVRYVTHVTTNEVDY